MALKLKWLTQQIPRKGSDATICTIGRQTSYLTDREIDRHLEHVGGDFVSTMPRWGKDSADDILLHTFGGSKVASVDVSDYEDATICADLNYPVDSALHQTADILIDGGSMEHVFNVSQCLYNYMNMTKIGGSLAISTTANNYCGHGFYQISPELFFSLFTEERGFSIKSVVFLTHPYPKAGYGTSKCYEVRSPQVLKRRVGLVSRKSVLIMVHAVKTRHVELDTVPFPIQSDYVELHSDDAGGSGSDGPGAGFARRVVGKLPDFLADHLRGLRSKMGYSITNKSFYKKWDPPY